jgi:hypothetical protein
MFCRSSLAFCKTGSRAVPAAVPDLLVPDAAGPFETRAFAEDVAFREVRHEPIRRSELSGTIEQETTMTKINSDIREPNNETAELTTAELDAVNGGTVAHTHPQTTTPEGPMTNLANMRHEMLKAVAQNLRS